MRAMSSGPGVHPITFGKGGWAMLGLCVALGACQATEAESVTATNATTSASPAVTTPAVEPASAPVVTQSAVASVDAEQDDTPVKRPDDSYKKATLRPGYTRCVNASQAVTSALEACGDEELKYHTDRLRQSVAKIVASPDGKPKDQLMDAQAAWWDDTDRYCAWDPKTEGQGQMLDAQSCRINRVANRADELQVLTSKM